MAENLRGIQQLNQVLRVRMERIIRKNMAISRTLVHQNDRT
jgi:hypothetical protein